MRVVPPTTAETTSAGSEMIPAIDVEATGQDDLLVSSVFSPLTQIMTGWSAQSLNDFCNGTGMDGYSAPQLNVIKMVLKNISMIPPDSLPCYFSQWVKTVGESNLTTAERNPLYIGFAAGSGLAYRLN